MKEAPLKIGLSARLMHDPPKELGFRGKTLQYLEQSIAHWLMAHGALVFMVPTTQSGGLTRAQVSMNDYVGVLDGLVLQGGADVSPTLRATAKSRCGPSGPATGFAISTRSTCSGNA
jgi:putative glutamine amidotransferase